MKKEKFSVVVIFMIFLIIVPHIFFYPVKAETLEVAKNRFTLFVDLGEDKLYLIDKVKNRVLKSYPIASGKFNTPSPVGSWKVVSMGKWSGGFGTRWIGLNVPWGKYGIHGTNKPYTIGRDESHGCIRMFNKDIEELYKHVKCGMPVIIYAGPNGPFEKGLRILRPGNRGADVYEVQRRLKGMGYDIKYVDGIYGEDMKKYVIKFRKDYKLSIGDQVDRKFYNKLGIRLID